MSTTTQQTAGPGARAENPEVYKPRRKGVVSGSLLTTFTWIAALVFFAPIAWMVMTSFKQENVAASSPPSFFFEPTLDQYKAVLGSDAAPYFLNSLIATGVSTLLVILLAIPASYALSIRPVKKTNDVLFFFISTKMLPIVAVIMPIYVISGQLRARLSQVWFPMVIISTPACKNSLYIFSVIPLPAAAFSPLTMVSCGRYLLFNKGKVS